MRRFAVMMVLLGAQAWAAAPDGGWYSPWKARQKVTVTTSRATPLPYAVAATLDHAALVAAGRSRADGSDLQLVRWTGTAWQQVDRVLDTGSAWNSPATRLWFAMPSTVADGGLDDDLYWYWDNPDAGAAREQPDAIFLAADGFEDGTLAKWTKEPADVSFSAGSGARTGNFCLQSVAAPGSAFGGYVHLAGTLRTKQIYVDSWWKLDDLNARVVQLIMDSPPTHPFDCGLDMIDGRFELARYDAPGTYTPLQVSDAGAVAGRWTRVGVYYDLSTNQLAVDLDGVPRGRVALGSGAQPGTVGFYRQVSVPYAQDGGAAWRVDDVRARAYVVPEPVVALGPEELAPTQPGSDGGGGNGADGGTSLEPRVLTVGCGCAQTGPAFLSAGLLVALGRRRRRPGREGARSV